MGLDYNIFIAPGFLIKNVQSKKINVPAWFLEELDAITDGGYTGKINNVFVPVDKIHCYSCGNYVPQWQETGMPNFIGDSNEYDENCMDLYADRLLEVFQKNPKGFRIEFCRIPTSDLPEEAYAVKINEQWEKTELIELLLEDLDLDVDENFFAQQLLENATYGHIVMKCYS